MKVIKVIVDEVPEYCEPCPFVVLGTKFMCAVTRKEIPVKTQGKSKRPDWCPLVEYDESSERIEELERLVDSYGDIISKYCIDNNTHIIGFND